MADRAQLEAWIAQSHVTQARLKIFLVIAAFVAVGSTFISHALGGLLIVCVGIVGGFGFWITNGHITDWQAQLRDVDKPKPPADERHNAHGRLRRQRD